MKVYSTNELAAPNIIDMIRILRDQLTAKDAADITATAFVRRKAGERVLLLRNAFPGAFDVTPLQFVVDGIDVAGQSAWHREYYSRLADAGTVPDRIVLDEEYAPLMTWELGQDVAAKMQPVFQDLQARMALPFPLRMMNAASFNNSNYNAGNVAGREWNTYVRNRMADLMTKMIDPARIFGHPVPISNYGYFRHDRQLADMNGWPLLPTGATVGTWSSPVLYAWEKGNLNAGKPNRVWLDFIANLNMLRAAANMPASPLLPWFSDPDFSEAEDKTATPRPVRRALWRGLILHARATGAENSVYWNAPRAGYAADADAFADSVFAEAAGIVPVKQRWGQIDAGAQAVVTGNVVTTFEQVMTAAKAA
jgi:hypothetical protein